MRDLSGIFEPVCSRREIDAIEKLLDAPLMERAGFAAAQFVRDGLAAGKVLVLAGPGNNGGDAFVAARHLKSWWIDVTLVFAGNPQKLPVEAARAYRAWLDCGGICHSAIPRQGKWDLAVDGLFGTGLTRPLAEGYKIMVEAVNALGIPILSLDMPSGVGSDTGAVLGAALKATHTLAFIALKPGLLTCDGLDHCGSVHLDRLGLDVPALRQAQGWVSNSKIVAACFKKRLRNSHKGTFGSTAIIGGATGMLGAALLAARAALKLGSGKVFLCALEHSGVDPVQPEIMVRDAIASTEASTLVFGPGLGKSESAVRLVGRALLSESALVIDADALNLVAEDPKLQQALTDRRSVAVLTPHPAEAARLAGCSAQEIQKDRIAAATSLVRKFGCPVVLKGAGSICAFPGGKWVINASGNPGLAQAGMGDVLSGMIGAFLSQGLSPDSALLCAVYLHGAAADNLSLAGVGPMGMTASELIDASRATLNKIVEMA